MSEYLNNAMDLVDVSFHVNIDFDICDFSEPGYLITNLISSFGEVERCAKDSNMLATFETDVDIITTTSWNKSSFASLITTPSLKLNRFKYLLIPSASGWTMFNWTWKRFGRQNPMDTYYKNYKIKQLIDSHHK